MCTGMEVVDASVPVAVLSLLTDPVFGVDPGLAVPTLVSTAVPSSAVHHVEMCALYAESKVIDHVEFFWNSGHLILLVLGLQER